MTFNVSYDQANKWLICSFTGTLDSKSAQVFAEAVADTASKHDCKCLLNDLRQAELDMSTVEIYHIPGMLDTTGIDLSWKRAIVAAGDLKDYRFFETVARNRGYRVRVFTDQDQAMYWLREKS